MRMLRVVGLFVAAVSFASAAVEVVALPGKSPLVTLRVLFRTGAAHDPADKLGLATLAANMITEGGTQKRTYKDLVEAMYPMASSVQGQVDKEMTVFTATTHVDNLEPFYALLKEMILTPGWRADDLARLRSDQVNFLRVSLRGNNDEELGKEVLYEQIYAGTPYGHVNYGKVSHLEKITVDDLKRFYATQYTQANLVLGLGGGYPDGFMDRVRKDFSALPAGSKRADAKFEWPAPSDKLRMTMVEKPTRSVAFSIGHPISVKRGDPDFPALLVAQSFLGQHRNSASRLYQRMRQLRGLNYGDYAYIEYFPRGMFQFEPDPNLGRRHQLFQVWIRPVEPANAHFALRLAMFELDRIARSGLSAEEFEESRSFVSKNVNLLLKTKSAELGYLLDSKYYGIAQFDEYIKSALKKLTVADVNKAIAKHIKPESMHIVVIGEGMEKFKAQLLKGDASPMVYNSPKPEDVMKEDKIVESWKIPVDAANISIVPVNTVFE